MNAIQLDFVFRMEELKEVLPEGLPMGMLKEFEESSRSALLVRQCCFDLRDNFRLAADPSSVVKSKGALFFSYFFTLFSKILFIWGRFFKIILRGICWY